jgi:putative spermidine/putrescine transport system substrate-binding protein
MRAMVIVTVLGVGASLAARAEDLVAVADKAKAEGRLTLAGVSRDRCNYGVIIDSFAERYPEIDVAILPAAEAVDPLGLLRGAAGEDAADVVFMDIVAAETARQENLLGVFVPYQLNELPANSYDLGYAWGGVYMEVAAIAVNADRVDNVPRSWADLARPEHKGQVALAHDPAGSPEGALLVAAAGSALTPGGPDPAAAGLDFFAGLAASGNLAPSPAGVQSLLEGTTPILVMLDTDAMRLKDAAGGSPDVKVVVPARGVIPEIRVQAISAAAPHPNAARLWAEYSFHNEPQLALLGQYCHPIRWSDFSQWNLLPEALKTTLPPSLPYDTIDRLPNADEVAARRRTVAQGWSKAVGAL